MFWVLQLGNIVQGLGYFIPALYLPGEFPLPLCLWDLEER
jgi:hypothetical protein